jgi:hypothetical protein
MHVNIDANSKWNELQVNKHKIDNLYVFTSRSLLLCVTIQIKLQKYEVWGIIYYVFQKLTQLYCLVMWMDHSWLR